MEFPIIHLQVTNGGLSLSDLTMNIVSKDNSLILTLKGSGQPLRAGAKRHIEVSDIPTEIWLTLSDSYLLALEHVKLIYLSGSQKTLLPLTVGRGFLAHSAITFSFDKVT